MMWFIVIKFPSFLPSVSPFLLLSKVPSFVPAATPYCSSFSCSSSYPSCVDGVWNVLGSQVLGIQLTNPTPVAYRTTTTWADTHIRRRR